MAGNYCKIFQWVQKHLGCRTPTPTDKSAYGYTTHDPYELSYLLYMIWGLVVSVTTHMGVHRGHLFALYLQFLNISSIIECNKLTVEMGTKRKPGDLKLKYAHIEVGKNFIA